MNGPTAWNIWDAQAGLDGLLKKGHKIRWDWGGEGGPGRSYGDV